MNELQMEGRLDMIDEARHSEEGVKKYSKLKQEEYLLRAKKHVLEHLSEEDIQNILNNPTYRAWAEKELGERESEKKAKHGEE